MTSAPIDPPVIEAAGMSSTDKPIRWLLQCWLRWPPGRHDWLHLNGGKVCQRCGVIR